MADAVAYESNVPPLKIYCVTWNVKAIHPLQVNFMGLLSPLWKRSISPEQLPDVFSFGFQEIVEMSAQQIFSTDLNRRFIWESQLMNCLNDAFGVGTYRVLSSLNLVGILLVVVVKADRLHFFRRVECFSRKTGLNGITGNKGTIGIRAFYGCRPICFLCSHMASGHESVSLRNKEYWNTLTESTFPSGAMILDNDAMVWSGDFNYRLDISAEESAPLLRARDIPQLLPHDQLSKERKNNNIFACFEEQPILFPPTYRFIVNSDLYDTSQRIPGWTDRIFSRGLQLKGYNWLEDVMESDHRPVYSFLYYETNYNPSHSGPAPSTVMQRPNDNDYLRQFRSQSPSQSIEAFRRSHESLQSASNDQPDVPKHLDRPGAIGQQEANLIDFSEQRTSSDQPSNGILPVVLASNTHSLSSLPNIDRWWE